MIETALTRDAERRRYCLYVLSVLRYYCHSREKPVLDYDRGREPIFSGITFPFLDSRFRGNDKSCQRRHAARFRGNDNGGALSQSTRPYQNPFRFPVESH
jgi:hypothetical protein